MQRNPARLGAVALIGCGWSAAPCAAGELSDLYARYASINQVCVNASVQINLADPTALNGRVAVERRNDPEPIQGWFVYQADGAACRMDSYLDEGALEGLNTTIAFDGVDFAYFARDAGILTITPGGPPPVLGMMLPNPAWAPVEFLFPLDNANDMSQPQLSDIVAAAAADPSGVRWQAVTFEGKALDMAVPPGATYDGTAYVQRVYAKPGAHDRPVVIERVAAGDGRILSQTRLSHYELVAAPDQHSWWWPRTVTMQASDDAGMVIAEISMVMEVVANEPAAVPPRAFDIGALAAKASRVIGSPSSP